MIGHMCRMKVQRISTFWQTLCEVVLCGALNVCFSIVSLICITVAFSTLSFHKYKTLPDFVNIAYYNTSFIAIAVTKLYTVSTKKNAPLDNVR